MKPTEKQFNRLLRKVRILEEMLEDRSRDSYVEAQCRSALNSLLTISLKEPALEDFFKSTLDILLSQDFFILAGKGAVLLADDSKRQLSIIAHQNFTPEQIKVCERVSYDLCPCGEALSTGKVVISRSAEGCIQAAGVGNVSKHGRCCLPLLDNNGHLGVICLDLSENMHISTEQSEFLNAVTDILAGAVQRTRYREQISAYQADLEEMVEQKLEELHQAETRYQDIFHNSPSGLFQVSLPGQFLDCNPALARTLGYDSPAEVIEEIFDISSQLYVNADERQKFIDLLRDGQVDNFVTQLKRKDDRLIWAQISARLVETKTESFVEGSILDISRRKEAEDNLVAEKERLLVTLRSIGDGVISTDASGRVTLLNKVAEHLTGWKLKDALGRSLTEVFRIRNQKTGELYPNPADKVIKGGEIIGLSRHTALISKDGIERSIADSGAPIRNHKSEIIGVVLVFRDVTEARRLEAEVQKKRQLESLGVLAGGIAHDFNNILTAILGNINLAEFLVEKDSKPSRLLKQAAKASVRASSLVQQLLTFSKGGEPIKKAASLIEIIEGVTDFLLRGSNISCKYQFADNLWLADIDPGQVSQVIQNLVINAKHAMSGGGIITIRCENITKSSADSLPLSIGRYIKITVQDQGCGIVKSKITNIFDPYFTTKDTGSGLGLAIVHSIIVKHGGHIVVESKLGQGTIFSLYFPASKQESLATPTGKTVPVTGKGRVLVMDDEEMVREITTEMLEMLGYDSIAVADGEIAIDKYKAAQEAGTPYCAVVMDLTIAGGMGGIEAVREILRYDANAKVLVASGYGNDPVLSTPKAYGFSGALVKPFQLEELSESLASIIF